MSANMSIPALQPPPGLRLLVAEDNDIVRRVFVTWARREQVAVDEARNGAEALQAWNDALLAFDILITDHAMPGMNGVELVRRIREHGTQAARQLRVIVFSGYLTDEETNAYRALGVSRFLQKPCLPQRLIAAIFQPDDSNGVYSPHS
jgi:CheY-like chemotaxis protein